MILGIGTDLTDIRRTEKLLNRFGERFISRCFTNEERQKAEKYKTIAGRSGAFAKRFAAKEAFAKALGTGFAEGVMMRDISVGTNENGRPALTLTGEALERLKAMTPIGKESRVHLSLSDEHPYAQAFVIIEAV